MKNIDIVKSYNTKPIIPSISTFTQSHYIMKSSLNWPPCTKKIRLFVKHKFNIVFRILVFTDIDPSPLALIYFIEIINIFSPDRPTGPIRSSSRDVRVYVCMCVCLSLLPIYALMYMFAPTSRSRMSKIFRDSESLGKSSGKKWSQN